MNEPYYSVCSRFHRAVELIGARWSGAILASMLDGQTRYADLKAAVPGLSDAMLSQRLRELEAAGLCRRQVVPTSPVRVEYHPTEMGTDLGPVLEAIAGWAHRWIEAPEQQGTHSERAHHHHWAPSTEEGAHS